MIKQNILRKNLLNNAIDLGNIDTEFEAENLNGNIIQDNPWITCTNEEKLLYDLAKAKQNKIAELNVAYSSRSNWIMILSSMAIPNASLTRDADWFGKMLSAVDGNVSLIDDDGIIRSIPLTITQARALNNYITIQKSIEIKLKRQSIEDIINNFSSVEEVDNYDILSELQSVNRNIVIEDVLQGIS
jgi:hypothetical protein